jgi:hypothetical protein
MAARIDKDELRLLVRQALKDALGATPAAPGSTRPEAAAPAVGFAAELAAALAKGRPARVAVAAQSAADLDRFARNVLAAGEHAELKAAIAAGDIRFEIAAGGPAARTEKPAALGGAFHIASGVLGETKVMEIARTHGRIVVGSDVVLTPLAREKARKMKVEIVRQKP